MMPCLESDDRYVHEGNGVLGIDLESGFQVSLSPREVPHLPQNATRELFSVSGSLAQP